MQIANRLCVPLLFLTICGCSTTQITSDYDPSVDFSHLKTWGWMPEPAAEGPPPKNHDAFVDARIRNAVEREMALKGYRKPASGNPDFLIGIQTAVESKLDVYTIDRHYGRPPVGAYPYPGGYPSSGGYPPGAGYAYDYGRLGVTVPETHTYRYDEGTLLLDIVDSKTWKPVWRGSAQAEVNLHAGPEKKQKRIDEAVRRILERFPPK